MDEVTQYMLRLARPLLCFRVQGDTETPLEGALPGLCPRVWLEGHWAPAGWSAHADRCTDLCGPHSQVIG